MEQGGGHSLSELFSLTIRQGWAYMYQRPETRVPACIHCSSAGHGATHVNLIKIEITECRQLLLDRKWSLRLLWAQFFFSQGASMPSKSPDKNKKKDTRQPLTTYKIHYSELTQRSWLCVSMLQIIHKSLTKTHLAPDFVKRSAHASGSKNSALNIGAKSWYPKFGG